MHRFGSIKRTDLIRYLKLSGFDGPFSGGEHQYMAKGKLKVRLTNPHKGDISIDLINKILKQAGISKADWEKL